MIVILYDTNCNLLNTIASNIKSGIESENKSCFLMSIGNIEYETFINELNKLFRWSNRFIHLFFL
jgi:hypothetical protein